MSITCRQYAELAADAYVERMPGFIRPQGEKPVNIEGAQFKVLEHYDNPKTGYQGTIYQRSDTGELVVAHRGTEFDREPTQDGMADGAMVVARVNVQVPEAIALTQRALERAREIGALKGHAPEVTITGHSLGGTLAQITAHRFNLRGEAFNSYGAANLSVN